MVSQTSLVAQQVRLQQWAEQIRDCKSRPVGMSVDTWCEQRGITKANYYYRVKRVREACLSIAEEPCSEVFVEIPTFPEPAVTSEPSRTGASGSIAAILRGTNGMALEVLSEASPSFVRTLIEAMAYVK